MESDEARFREVAQATERDEVFTESEEIFEREQRGEGLDDPLPTHVKVTRGQELD